MSETLQRIKEFKDAQLLALLEQLTPEQQALFKRRYFATYMTSIQSLENIPKYIPDRQYNWAVLQVEDAIKQNKEVNGEK